MLLKQRKINKWTTPYEPSFYVVIKINGSAVTVRRIQDGRELTRDASQLKLANTLMQHERDESTEVTMQLDTTDWREELLKNAGQSEIDHDEQKSDQQTEENPARINTSLEQATRQQNPRRSGRQRKTPTYLRDYVTSG